LACGTDCINPMTDATHCGASGDCTEDDAGEVCSPPNTCQSGECVLTCSGGEVKCNDSCIDPLVNDTFCGASGNCSGNNRGTPCANDEACESGVCRLQCPGNQVPCSGDCIDPDTEQSHCGATNYCQGDDAGDMCGNGEQCVEGACRLPDGSACDVGADCISGICTAFYRDADGDGYGAESSGVERVCGLNSLTSGCVTNDLDCCDLAD